MNEFFKMLKENKKLSYAVNVFILLVIISLILKLDFSKVSGEPVSYQDSEVKTESYVYAFAKNYNRVLQMFAIYFYYFS
jgi:hypothetical protein